MNDLDTLAYYDRNADAFSADTVSVDLGDIQKRFLSHLPSGASILDLGCGAGRDSLLFKNLGYDVTATDGSVEMCRVASRTTGMDVRQLLFEDLDYVDSFDGVWACSSLLHVPSARLKLVFSLVHRVLVSDGIFYSSFKYGSFEGERNGRYFTDLNEDLFSSFCDGLFDILDIWITSDARPGRSDEKWLNAIVKKV